MTMCDCERIIFFFFLLFFSSCFFLFQGEFFLLFHRIFFLPKLKMACGTVGGSFRGKMENYKGGSGQIWECVCRERTPAGFDFET